MPQQPLAEVFGFPAGSMSEEAQRSRRNRLCPYNNRVPNCTKDSVIDPLGVCTIFDGNALAVICPVRFRQDWMIAEHAARFFFPDNTRWTTLVEVRLNDRYGKSAGNIDVVVVAYNEEGTVTDFGSLEVQAVYISGNLRKSFFKPYSEGTDAYLNGNWANSRLKSPRPDYLSSSRKRLAPQLIYKGGIFQKWGKKQAVAVHSAFFDRLPDLPQVSASEADIAWLVYDLIFDPDRQRYDLTLTRTVYTQFQASLDAITTSEAGDISDFMANLQGKLTARLSGASPSETADVPVDIPADATDLLDDLTNL